MPKLSKKLLIALKAGDQPMYKVAQRAGVHPTTLSKLVAGIEIPRRDDPRVVRVGRVLGIPARALFSNK